MKPHQFVLKSIKYLWRETVPYMIWHFSSYFPLFPTIMYRRVRALTWRLIGGKIGKQVRIGYGVYLDVSTMHQLTIDDYVGIGAECSLQRKRHFVCCTICIENDTF